MKRIDSARASKSFTLILVVILLLNPAVIYLVTGSLLTCLLGPILFGFCYFLLRGVSSLKPLSVIVFNLMLLISFLIYTEAVFTFRFSDYIIEDLYIIKDKYYFNKPYLNQTFRDKEFIVQYRTNSQGFRIGTEDEVENKVDLVDWLFLGDSYTQGAQVQYEELFTSKLYKSFPDKIIVNAGISGLGIADEYHYYINEGKKLKPKKVFLQICNFNDFMNVKERSSGFSDYLMHHSNFARFILYDFKYSNPTELPLGRWAEPFYPDSKSNEDYNVFYTNQSAQKKRDLQNFEYYLYKFVTAVRENGAELIVIQIPTKEQVTYRYLEEAINTLKINPKMLDMEYPNTFLHQLCLKNSIKHIDLLSDFTSSDDRLFFEYDEHLNVRGHQQVAQSVAAHLKNSKTDKRLKSELLSMLNIGDRYPNFASQNGNFLIYQSFRDGNMEIFLCDSILSQTKRITWDNVDQTHPFISSDGGRVVFTEGDSKGDETKIVVMDLVSGVKNYLIPDINTFAAIPTFDKAGSRVTFAQWHKIPSDGRYSNPYIVVHNLMNGSVSKITNDATESWRPVFSPDGEKLLYISKKQGGQFDIYEHNLLTGLKRNLTNSVFEEWDVAISPNGRDIVYAAKVDSNWDLYLKCLETGEITQITQSRGNEWDPTFSPDGKYIYYSGTFGLRNGIFRIKLK